MLGNTKNLPVNWIDGMKISRRHFTELENFVHDSVRDANASRLASYAYGILPAERALDLSIQCDFNQQVVVQLRNCQAVTPNGCRVDVQNSDSLRVQTSLKDLAETYKLNATASQSFEIILTVTPFARVPVGEPTPGETPPRHPYTLPEYRLDVVPTEFVNVAELSSHLLVGRITYANGELRPATDYIPACAVLISLPALQDWHGRLGNVLNDMETNAYRIMQKVRAKGQKSTLNDSINFLCERLVARLNEGGFAYQWVLPQQAPIFWIDYLMGPAHTLSSVVNCLSDREKEELIGYLSEWADLTPGAFEGSIAALGRATYQHTELARLIQDLDTFYKMLSTVLSKLSQLEFVGKRKGQNVFIIEHQVQDSPATASPAAPPPQQPPAEKPKTRWSPLG
ncbi:MAG: hypothetical protein LH606_00385 [Cytophagaceae bacterium]|nr:hypothetical protein [Cytophagaceae bacterium]